MIRLFNKQHLREGAAFMMGMMVMASTLAQDGDDHAASSVVLSREDGEVVQQAMLDMQYADELGCFIIHGDEVRPVMPLLVSSDGLPDVSHEHVIAALNDALARGCDINQPDLIGLSPLNTAILQGNVTLVRYLVEKGADPTLSISSPNAEIDGLDSDGLLNILFERAPEDGAVWQQIHTVITNDGMRHPSAD